MIVRACFNHHLKEKQVITVSQTMLNMVTNIRRVVSLSLESQDGAALPR